MARRRVAPRVRRLHARGPVRRHERRRGHGVRETRDRAHDRRGPPGRTSGLRRRPRPVPAAEARVRGRPAPPPRARGPLRRPLAAALARRRRGRGPRGVRRDAPHAATAGHAAALGVGGEQPGLGPRRGRPRPAPRPRPGLPRLAANRAADAARGGARDGLGGRRVPAPRRPQRQRLLPRRPRRARRLELRVRGQPRVRRRLLAPSLHAEGGPPPEAILPRAPEVAAVLAGYFAARAGLPPPRPGSRVRDVQRQQLSTALPWACRALGLAVP
jgi:hypothetical protein